MSGPGARPLPGTPPKLRLDKWLWQARFFKTRAEAALRIEKGKVRINGQRCTKPGHGIMTGDVLTFAQEGGVRVIRILGLGLRRGPASEAQLLYLDVAVAAHAAATLLE